MTGYTRTDVSNNIADGNVINASDLDNEFDAIDAAFNFSTGHTHDGTSNGAPITKVGPTQDVVISASAVTPKTTNTVDLGSSLLQYKDLYLDGTANIDSLVADTADINAGTIDGTAIGGTTAAAGSFTTLSASSTATLNTLASSGATLTGGTINDMAIGGTTASSGAFTTLSASSTVSGAGFSTYLASPPAIGGTTAAAGTFTTLTANTSLTAATADINGGTIDGSTIGGTTPAAGSFTTLAASGAVTLSGGTANGVTYLNGSKVLTSGSGLVFDGTNLGLGVTPSAWASAVKAIDIGTYSAISNADGGGGGASIYGNAYATGVGTWAYKQSYYATLYRTNYTGQHQWFTAASGTAGNAISFTQAMTLDASGRLGVGVTSPAQSIHTNGRVRVSTDNSTGGDIGINGGGLAFSTLNAAAPIIFERNNYSAESARITSSGDLLVGGISSLPIQGATGTGIYGSAGRINIANNSSSATAMAFYSSTQNTGTITTTASTTAYNIASDYRLKENVTTLTGAADRVKALKPSRFNFIADPTKTVDGFLAHEAQAVVPEAVTGEKDAVDAEGNPIYQGIDQAKLVPLLTAALQEALARVESLESRLTAAGL